MGEAGQIAASPRLKLGTIVVWSLSTLPISALGTILFVYLPPYLNGSLGVSLATIGFVWFAVRVIDLGVDPVLGYLMDRTDTPVGRYRAWLLAGAPVFMLSTYMLFLAPKGISGLYLFIWLFILYVGNSMLSLSQSAWSATLSTTYADRSRVFGIGTAAGVIATVVGLLIPVFAPLFGLSGDASVRAMGWLIIAMTPLGIGIAAWATPEHVNRTAGHQFAAADVWHIIGKPEVIRLFLAQVALTLGPGWMSALYLFYFHDVRGYTQQQSTLLLLIYILVGIVGAVVTARLSSRFGKHRTLMFSTTAFSVALLTIPVIPKGSVLAGAPLMAWCGFMATGFGLTISSMMADVGDEIRLQQGKERISLLYAVLSFASKLTSAFSIGLTLPILGWFGYHEGGHNSPQALSALSWLFITGPIVFVMLGGVCVVGWKLDAKRHAEIRTQLDLIDSQQLSPAP